MQLCATEPDHRHVDSFWSPAMQREAEQSCSTREEGSRSFEVEVTSCISNYTWVTCVWKEWQTERDSYEEPARPHGWLIISIIIRSIISVVIWQKMLFTCYLPTSHRLNFLPRDGKEGGSGEEAQVRWSRGAKTDEPSSRLKFKTWRHKITRHDQSSFFFLLLFFCMPEPVIHFSYFLPLTLLTHTVSGYPAVVIRSAVLIGWSRQSSSRAIQQHC